MKGLGLGLVLAGFAAVVGCGDSGQTGSTSCALPESCECHALAGRTLAEATVIALDQRVVRLALEQLLTVHPALGPSDVHRTLVGELTFGAACGASIEPAIGDRVFAAFFPAQHCPEYYQCLSRECSSAIGSAFDACTKSCEAECDPNEIPVDLWIQPWGATISVGEGPPITVSDAIELTDAATCDARYPPPPSLPCNDNGDSSCSVASSAWGTRDPTGSGWAGAALALLTLGARRLRLARPRPA